MCNWVGRVAHHWKRGHAKGYVRLYITPLGAGARQGIRPSLYLTHTKHRAHGSSQGLLFVMDSPISRLRQQWMTSESSGTSSTAAAISSTAPPITWASTPAVGILLYGVSPSVAISHTVTPNDHTSMDDVAWKRQGGKDRVEKTGWKRQGGKGCKRARVTRSIYLTPYTVYGETNQINGYRSTLYILGARGLLGQYTNPTMPHRVI